MIMNRQLIERLVGAGVLVLALIIIAPTMLDGTRPSVSRPLDSSGRAPDTADSTGVRRTHTIHLDRPAERPPVAHPVPDVAAVEQEPAAEKPAQTATVKKPATGQPPATAVAPEAAVLVVPAKPSSKPRPEPKPEPKPESKAKSDTKTSQKTATAATTGNGWAVQLGAYSRQDSARNLVKEVGAKGFTAYIVTVKQADKTLYRVRVGPEKTRSAADALAGRLAAAGYKGQITAQKSGS
jgi:DedD protein